MAKRGQKYPWKVDYVWDGGDLKGRVAYMDQERAELEAARIRRSAEIQDRTVEVKVSHQPER